MLPLSAKVNPLADLVDNPHAKQREAKIKEHQRRPLRLSYLSVA
jgi:hypothetical protein